jgi:hypothetical protein
LRSIASEDKPAVGIVVSYPASQLIWLAWTFLLYFSSLAGWATLIHQLLKVSRLHV